MPLPGTSAPEAVRGWPWEEIGDLHDRSSLSEDQLPTISIVTPSFNQCRYLELTIRSVLLQEYPRLEYILMDGGSTDGSVDVIKEYAPWLHHWESKPDCGQSDAINRGFLRGTGGVMAWLNSDDYLEPGALWEVARVFTGVMSPGWAIGDVNEVDSSGELIHSRRIPGVEPHAFINWMQDWFPQQGTFWNREMWEKTGPLKEDLYYTMDFDLWCRMFEIARPVPVGRTVASYRFHGEAKCSGRSSVRGIKLELIRFWLRQFCKLRPDITFVSRSEMWRAVVRAALFGRL